METLIMRRARLRFWLFALDVAEYVRAPQRLYLWIVRRASDATDWGECPPSNGWGE